MLFLNYVLRKLARRIGSNAFTVFVIASVVAGGMFGVAFVRGLRAAAHEAIPADHVVVLARGAISEAQSMGLMMDVVNQIEVLPQAKTFSAEIVAQVYVDASLTGSGVVEPEALRGLGASGRELRRIKIIDGRAPADGAPELLIGKQLRRKHPGLGVGAKLQLPGETWEIVGVFDAGGAVYESELWGERARLATTLKKVTSSSVLIATGSEQAARELAASINTSKRFAATAQLDREYRGAKANLAVVSRIVMIVAIALCIVGVFITATNLYASLMSRLFEFTTLIALGVRRGRVVRLVVLESVLVALAGAAIAAVLSRLVDGRSSAQFNAGALFDLDMGLVPNVVGLGLALVIGLLGGVFPALVLRRIDLVRGLR